MTLLRKKEKKRNTTTYRKKKPSHKLKHKGFVIRKKRLKLQQEVYMMYQEVNFLKYSTKIHNIQIIIFINPGH